MEQKPTIAEIGGYSNTQKSDPMPRARFGPIRAYGESEVRMRPTVALILAAKLKRLQRHGSRLVKVAIKRALKAEGRRFKWNVTLFPVYDMTSDESNGPKPQGLLREVLMQQVTFMRRGVRPSPEEFPFGDGRPFNPNFSKLLADIDLQILRTPRTPEDTKRIMESSEFEAQYRRTMGDSAWERRQGILKGIEDAVKKEGEKKNDE